MKGTQSGPARRASVSSRHPTHPHQCTINEILIHSASQSTHTCTQTHTPLTYSLSLATFITTHAFKYHLEPMLQLAFHDRLLLEGSTVVASSPSPTLSILYSSGVTIAVHMCSTNIWVAPGNAERASVSCWQKDGDLNRFEPRAHRLPDSISPSRESCALNQSIWPAVESRSGMSPFSQQGSAWTRIPTVWRRLQMESITCTLSVPTATDLSMALLGLRAFAKRNRGKKKPRQKIKRKWAWRWSIQYDDLFLPSLITLSYSYKELFPLKWPEHYFNL